MATFRILLANPYAFQQNWHDQVRDVKAMFDPIVQYSTAYDSIHVRSEYVAPTNFACELCVYVVPDSDHSLVGRHFAGIDTADLAGSDGCTEGKMVDGRLVVGSEIFLTNLTTVRDRSLLIYHEAMHNILKMNDAQLHRLGGLAGRAITPDTERKASNDRRMGRALANVAQQWQGGFAAA